MSKGKAHGYGTTQSSSSSAQKKPGATHHTKGGDPYKTHGPGAAAPVVEDPFVTHGQHAGGGDVSEDDMLLAEQQPKGGLGFHMESVLTSTLIPWTVFVIVAASCGLPPPTGVSRLVFNVVVCMSCAFAALLIVVFFAQPPHKRKRWYLHLGLMSFVAVFAGWVAGRMVFNQDAAQYWLESARQTYTDVLPSGMTAAALADAAFVTFADGARVDLARVLGYRPHGSSSVYCVAPILDEQELGKGEFWAAGMDCCGRLRDFRCGDVMDPAARSGAVMAMDVSSYAEKRYEHFRHAVSQAASLYHMSVPEKPILVRWVKDPEAEHRGVMMQGVMSFTFMCLLYFMVSLVSAAWFHWSNAKLRSS